MWSEDLNREGSREHRDERGAPERGATRHEQGGIHRTDERGRGAESRRPAGEPWGDREGGTHGTRRSSGGERRSPPGSSTGSRGAGSPSGPGNHGMSPSGRQWSSGEGPGAEDRRYDDRPGHPSELRPGACGAPGEQGQSFPHSSYGGRGGYAAGHYGSVGMGRAEQQRDDVAGWRRTADGWLGGPGQSGGGGGASYSDASRERHPAEGWWHGPGSSHDRSFAAQRGPHVGKGPKGWKRSDERIQEDVSEQLSRHPELDASDIEVSVENGEVILAGTVEERYYKRLAEDVAEQVFGVTDVRNQIRIQRPGSGVGWGDREVARLPQREAAAEAPPDAGGSGRSSAARVTGESADEPPAPHAHD